MIIALGLALMAIAILMVRGAMIFAVSPAVPGWFRDFLSGATATLLIITVMMAGLMVTANSVLSGLWKTSSWLDVVVWLAIAGTAVLTWTWLGRLDHAARRQQSADILSMPAPRPTPSTAGATGMGRGARKRAA